MNFPCEICMKIEIQEKRKDYVETNDERYNMYLIKGREIITTTEGRKILTCPYNSPDEKSTVCLKQALNKLTRKVIGTNFNTWPYQP